LEEWSCVIAFIVSDLEPFSSSTVLCVLTSTTYRVCDLVK
jgi:hypothetical protein